MAPTHVQSPDEDVTGEAVVSEHVAQNIETIAHLHAEAEHRVGRHQRAVEKVTGLLARPQTLYAFATGVVLWVVGNLAAPSLGFARLDAPPFFWLQGLISLGALFMTTMVLTTQKRQARRVAQRDHLDLQVNLIAEQKIAKVISLLEELRRDLPSVRDRLDPVAEAMTEAVDTNAMVSVLEQTVEVSKSQSNLEHPKTSTR